MYILIEKELSRRIDVRLEVYKRYIHLFKSEVKMKLKKGYGEDMTVMTYRSQTGVLNDKNNLRTAQTATEKFMQKITRKYRKIDKKRHDKEMWVRQ